MRSHAAGRLVFFVAVGFSSCSVDKVLTDIFGTAYDDRYYDTSRNWLSGFDLDAFQGNAIFSDPLAPGYAEPLANGAWDWAWRGRTDTAGFGGPGGEFPYMTLAAAGTAQDAATAFGETLPAALPAAAPAFRLALANLFVNGDLEEDTDLSGSVTAEDSGWAQDGSGSMAPPPYVALISSGTNIHGNSLKISDLIGSSRVASLDLSNGGTGYRFADEFPASASYYLSFVYTSTEDVRDSHFNIDGNKLLWGAILPSSSTPALLCFPTPSLTVGTKVVIENALSPTLVMDDFGAVRADKGRELVLRLAATDTRLPGKAGLYLEPGLYRFSVWVHADGASSAMDSPGAADPYRTRSLALTMRPHLAANGGAATDGETAYRVFSASEWSGGWTKLSVDFDSDIGLTFPAKTSAGVIELRIQIGSDGTSAYPGTLLLARPELNLFLQGY